MAYKIDFEALLDGAIREAVSKAVSDETEEACTRLRMRLSDEIAQIAVRVASSYDVQRDGKDIIIRVRDETKEAP